MSGVTTPPVIPEPFATSGDAATIPDTTVAPGRASYSAGFPAITMQPIIAGGIPPDGRDFNGILKVLSQHAFFLQAGQLFKYSADVATAISGYAVGTLLESNDGLTVWLNIVDGNSTDPNASGAGWVPVNSYGTGSIAGLIGGTRVLTRVEARFELLVLSGALVANQIISLPTDIRSWRIVNLTTGAFTTTVNVVGSTGVVVPQGGYTASVGIYSNGSEIFLQDPPVALPIAVTPDPDTLAKRDNVGDLFARYFNGSSAPEAFAIGNVMATTGVDGYLRKMSFGNFLLQALASAALTGTPTAPTAAPGTNTTQVATTAFVLAALLGGPSQSWAQLVITNGATNTNSSPRPIQIRYVVSINGTPGGNTGITVGGTSMAGVAVSGGNAVQLSDTFTVPAGSTWVLAWAGSVNSINVYELA